MFLQKMLAMSLYFTNGMNIRLITVIMVLFILSTSFIGCIETDDESDYNEYKATVETLDGLYANASYEEMINVVTEYLQDNGLNKNNFDILEYRALAYSILDQEDLAIEDYEAMLPFIYSLDEVEQKEFSYDILFLGYLYSNKGNIEKAYEYYRYALQIDPLSSQSDIDYTAWSTWKTACSTANLSLSGELKGETIREAMELIRDLTNSDISVNGSGLITFLRRIKGAASGSEQSFDTTNAADFIVSWIHRK